MEAALQATPGRCLLNSTNFEGGDAKAKIVFELAQKYGAAVLVLTIDERGMARSVAQKLAIVDRAYQLAVGEMHLLPHSLVFDPLTFSLASGDAGTLDSAVQTLSAIRAIKQKYPDCHTSLGISNVSYGFSKQARKILNSVFLYHALQAGLDMAILNAADLIPYPEIPAGKKWAAEQLIFNNSEHALANFIEAFTDIQENNTENRYLSSITALKPGEKVRWRITNRVRDGLENDITAFIQQESQRQTQHEAALSLLNKYLLPAMKEVGDQFSKGEIILPFVLQSSEIMRAATIKLEEYIQKKDQTDRGSILLATVYGDVHDIGKNLVKTILENNGFSVIDLGKQVPADQIIDEAIEKKVTAIGLSALLVNTSQQMPIIVEKLRANNSKISGIDRGSSRQSDFRREDRKR
jgi:5-methyltetrahydrofolate--homocysteine methyltransferase